MSQLPRYGQSFLLPNGSIAPVWYDYLRTLDASSLTAEIERQVQANTEAIKALQQAGFGDYLPAGAYILGVDSVETFGDLASGTQVRLRGDSAAPEASRYYGTNADGERGFHPVPEPSPGGGGGILPMVNGEAPPVLMYGGNQLIYARVE